MKVFITNYTFRQLLTDKDVKKIKVDWGVLEPFIKYLDNDSRKLFERMKDFLDDLNKSDVKGRQEKSEPWVNLSKGLRYHTENTCEFLHKNYTNWQIPKRIDPELYDDYRIWFKEHIHIEDFHRLFIKKWGFEFNEKEVTRKNSGNFSLTSKSVDEIVKELRGYLNNLEDWLKKDDNESDFNTFKKIDFKVYNLLNPLDKPKLDEFIHEYQLPIKNLVETVLHFQFGNYFTGKESELEKLGIKICSSCNANVLYEEPNDLLKSAPYSLVTPLSRLDEGDEVNCSDPPLLNSEMDDNDLPFENILSRYEIFLDDRGVLGPSKDGQYACATHGSIIVNLDGLSPIQAFQHILNACQKRHEKQGYKIKWSMPLIDFLNDRGIPKFDIISDRNGLPLGNFYVGTESVGIELDFSTSLLPRRYLTLNRLKIICDGERLILSLDENISNAQ